MKIVKPRLDLIYLFAPLLAIGLITAAWILRSELLMAFNVNWLILTALIILSLLPHSRLQLRTNTSDKSRQPILNWLTQIVLLQLCLMAVFLGICYAVMQPIAGINPPANLFVLTMDQLLRHYGLLPWTLCTGTALAIGYYSYNKNQNSYFSALLFPLFKSHEQQTMGLIINVTTKNATLVAIACTFALMSLMLTSLLSGSSIHLITGFNPTTLYSVVILLVICLIPFVRDYIMRFINSSATMPTILCAGIILLALLILLLNFFLQGLASATIPIPNLISMLISKDWNTSWKLFATAWWLSWTPLMGILLASLSRGYSVRQIIAGTLFFPAIMSLVFTFFQHQDISLEHYHPMFNIFIAIIGFVGLMSQIMNKKHLDSVTLSYLPAGDQHKRRDYHVFFYRVLLIAITILYLYLPTGVTVSYLLILGLALPAAFWAVLAIGTVYIQLLKN